jgi:hypothetical protein
VREKNQKGGEANSSLMMYTCCIDCCMVCRRECDPIAAVDHLI